MNILRARKNANISISVANSNNANNNAIDNSSFTPSTFRKGGVLHKKPTIGDVVFVEGNYGLVTDTYGKKIEVKNLDKQDALRILKENKNGATVLEYFKSTTYRYVPPTSHGTIRAKNSTT